MLTRFSSSRALPPGSTFSALPRIAEAVLGELVAVALDVEEDLLAHQAGLVEGGQAVAVGDEPRLLTVSSSTSGTPRPVSASTTSIAKGSGTPPPAPPPPAQTPAPQ